MEAREERQFARMRSGLSKLDLLVLDELGYVPASKIGAELLFDVISTAYERASLIVTTNLPFENWTRGPGQQAIDGSDLGQADPSLPHSGNARRQLPASGGETASWREEEEGQDGTGPEGEQRRD